MMWTGETEDFKDASVMKKITACMTDEETNTSYLFSSCLKDGAN